MAAYRGVRWLLLEMVAEARGAGVFCVIIAIWKEKGRTGCIRTW